MAEITNLQSIVVTEESAANFGTDLSASATYYPVPFKEGSASVSLNWNYLDPQTNQQVMDGYATQIAGPKSATLTLTMPLHSLGSAADDSTASLGKTDAALLMILGLTWGGIRSGDMGSTVDGGSSTTTAIDVQTGHGSRFEAGGAIGLLSGDNGELEVREVASVSGDTVTVKDVFSNAPGDTDDVYNATTIYPKDNPTSALQFMVQGSLANDCWVLIGGQCTSALSISRPNGQIPEVTFTFEFADFASEAATISQQTFTNYAPVYSKGFILVGGLPSPESVDAAQQNYTFNGPVYQRVSSPSGTNTTAAWRRSRAVPFVSLDQIDARESSGTIASVFPVMAGTQGVHLSDQIGTAAGGSITIVIPSAQAAEYNPVDEGGLAYQSTVYRAGLDVYTGSQSTELLRAPCRIHFV